MAFRAEMMILDTDCPRYVVDLPAEVRVSGIAKKVRLADISIGGCSVIGAGVRLAVGDKVAIGTTVFGVRTAKVAWCTNDKFGCKFEQPLSRSIADRALKMDKAIKAGSPASTALDVAFRAASTCAKCWMQSALLPCGVALVVGTLLVSLLTL